MRVAGLTVVLAAACASSGPAPAPAPPVVAAAPPLADPLEYQLAAASRAAGERLFVTSGLGDPYATGIPYPIYLALIEQYPAQLGGDLAGLAARFGMVARAPDPASDDRDLRDGLPLGVHVTDDPITGVGFVVHSCALCHAAPVRWDGGAALVIGLGNPRLRVHTYDAAFALATRQPGFTVEALAARAARIAAARHLAWPAEWQLPLVRATVTALRQRARDRGAFLARAAGGLPGRVATIEAFALALGAQRGRPIATAPDVGWAKIPDVIGFAARTTLSFDGAGEGPMDALVVEADFAAGARPAWFDAHPLFGPSLGAYLRQPDRDLPFPGPIDRAAAARGRALFDDACAPCHGRYDDAGRVRDYDEQVVALADLGTDPARALAVTDDFVAAANQPSLTRGYLRTRRTGGYVPPILTDAWLHAPYGHAGQWTSLAVLALPPAQRPRRAVVDLDGPRDLRAVGVAVRPAGAPPGPGEYLLDGDAAGTRVDGHPFLADLGPADAAAVVEYLKTL